MYEPSTVDPTSREQVKSEDGRYSGRFDDRWAFTSNTSALNYGSAAALAAASRALRGYNDALADECLATAKKVWQFEAGRSPNTYFFGNTTGGKLEDERLKRCCVPACIFPFWTNRPAKKTSGITKTA